MSPVAVRLEPLSSGEMTSRASSPTSGTEAYLTYTEWPPAAGDTLPGFDGAQSAVIASAAVFLILGVACHLAARAFGTNHRK